MPTIPTTFYTQVTTWLVQLFSGIAILMIAWSAIQQLDPGQRDFKKLGAEVFGVLMLLLLMSKAETIITTLKGWMGIALQSDQVMLAMAALSRWRGPFFM